MNFGARFAKTVHQLNRHLGKPDHIGTWRDACDNQSASQTRDVSWGELTVEFGRGSRTPGDNAHGRGRLLDFEIFNIAEYYDQATGKIVRTSTRYVSTSRGIRPGSTARQVKKTYGKAATYYPGDPSFSIMQKPYYVVTAKHHQAMTVNLKRRRPNGLVNTIDAGGYCIAE